MQRHTTGFALGKSAAGVTRPDGQASCSISEGTGSYLIGDERITAKFPPRFGIPPDLKSADFSLSSAYHYWHPRLFQRPGAAVLLHEEPCLMTRWKPAIAFCTQSSRQDFS